MHSRALGIVAGCFSLSLFVSRSFAQGPAPVPTPGVVEPTAPVAPGAPAMPPPQPQVSPPDALSAALERWGCQALSVLEHGGRWYAACGPAGVFVVEQRGASLEVVERRQGFARALYVRDGTLWVELTRVEARPIEELAPVAIAAPVPTSRAVPLPTMQPSASEPVANPPLVQRGEGPDPLQHESRTFPSRTGGVSVLQASLRPILPIDTLSFAGLAELSFSYRWVRPWFVEARLFPLGGLVGEGRDTPVLGALALGGYDHPWFAVALGAGTIMRGRVRAEFDRTLQAEVHHGEQSAAFAATQFARLGATDGLHLTVRSSFVLLDAGWHFAMIEVAGQIPLGQGTWLVPAGGGGSEAGFFYGEVGLRRMLRGDRGSGSLFVRPSAGLAGVQKRDHDNDMRPGPMVGVHLEWRK